MVVTKMLGHTTPRMVGLVYVHLNDATISSLIIKLHVHHCHGSPPRARAGLAPRAAPDRGAGSADRPRSQGGGHRRIAWDDG